MSKTRRGILKGVSMFTSCAITLCINRPSGLVPCSLEDGAEWLAKHFLGTKKRHLSSIRLKKQWIKWGLKT